MNNEQIIQIRKLFEQAITDCDATPEFGIREILVPNIVLEKFVESIVQECVDIMTDTGDSEWNSYGRTSANEIKEHFGVK